MIGEVMQRSYFRGKLVGLVHGSIFSRVGASSKPGAVHPQTNGICERFHKTILQEFYQVAFRRIYRSIEELEVDLDEWNRY